MKPTYKDFYKFVQINNDLLCRLWDDFNNRPDPQPGMEYDYFEPSTMISSTIIFDKILYDENFKNGVAFFYIFYNKETNTEVRIHTINDVYDYAKLTNEDKADLFRFWKYCKPKN